VPSSAGDDFHHVRPAKHVGRGAQRGRAQREALLRDLRERATHGSGRDEGLVTLHVDDRVEAAAVGARRDFGHAVRPARMRWRR
jgi:hypothetical protein